MDFSKDTFFDCVRKINEQNYSFGNEILYRNCSFEQLPELGMDPLDTKLSSMIWLIGKSYSADPTRSAPPKTFSDKGLGDSFERIAQKVYASGAYTGFYNDLKELHKEKYAFNQSDTDHKTLLKTVQLVDKLNGLLKEAMTSIARDKDPKASDSANVISFCSKFLHFMCPDLFFIYDSFSYSGGSALFGKTKNRVLDASDRKGSRIVKLDDAAQKFFQAEGQVPAPLEHFEEHIAFYYKHCLRAYALAVMLKKEGIECERQIPGGGDSRYMLRLVDSVLMRITKEAEK